jgi:hypothetical protein
VIYTPVRSLTVNGDGGFGASNPFMPVVADTIKFSGNSVTQADQTVMRPAEPLPSFSIGARLAN